MSKVALVSAHRHLDVEVTDCNLVGGMDEPPDRRDKAVGEVEAEPHGRQ
jgi:hypothetical protein